MGGENKTGYLEVLVLDELEVASQTGYELMLRLEKKLGNRPSPGSMYPLLNRMFLKKLISVDVEGRKKKYSLTASGRKFLKEKMKEKEHSISRNIALFKSMIGNSFCVRHPMMNILNVAKVSRKISPETAKLLLEMKESILNVVLSNEYSKNEKQFNKTINESIKSINKMSVRKQKNKNGGKEI